MPSTAAQSPIDEKEEEEEAAAQDSTGAESLLATLPAQLLDAEDAFRATLGAMAAVQASRGLKRVLQMLVGMGVGGDLLDAMRCRDSRNSECPDMMQYLHAILKTKLPRLVGFHEELSALQTTRPIGPIRQHAVAWRQQLQGSNGVQPETNGCSEFATLMQQVEELLTRFANEETNFSDFSAHWGLNKGECNNVDEIITVVKSFVADYEAVYRNIQL